MKVHIANPRPGSSRFTSQGRAQKYVARGVAVQIGNELTFLQASEQNFMRWAEEQIVDSQRSCSDVYVGDRQIWWNGNEKDDFAMKRPGEVRS